MGFKIGQTVSCKNKNLVLQGVVSDAYHEDGINWIELQGIDNEFEASEFELIKELEKKPENEICPFCTPNKQGKRKIMFSRTWYTDSSKMRHTQIVVVGRKRNKKRTYALMIRHNVYYDDGFRAGSHVDQIDIFRCPKCGRDLEVRNA
ncbi:hypothetical protein JH67_02935 [Listeria monocytogenes]|nr:hypothetical protein [Listeria monocytogenes]